MQAKRADDWAEVLELARLYGPGGERGEDAAAVALYTGPPPITTSMQVERCLGALRAAHARWGAEHGET